MIMIMIYLITLEFTSCPGVYKKTSNRKTLKAQKNILYDTKKFYSRYAMNGIIG